MSDIDDLAAWLSKQLDYDEFVAIEACGEKAVSALGQRVPEHWQWVHPDDDEVLELDPVLDEHVGDGIRASLRSVEQYPVRWAGQVEGAHHTLPTMAIWSAEEVPTMVGMHIVNWDPARVVADVAAKRAVLEEWRRGREDDAAAWQAYAEWVDGLSTGEAPRRRTETETVVGLERALRLLAAGYAHRPGWQESWRG